MKEKFDALSCLVGHTPMVEILLTFDGKERRVYAKLEHLNLTGSIKDRMARPFLKNGYENWRREYSAEKITLKNLGSPLL